MIRVGIIGGTGYTGVELLALLAGHPDAQVTCVTSRAETGRRVDDLFASLRGHYDLAFEDPDEADLGSCDVVFFATPNAIAMRQAGALLERGVKIVDLSADFRLKDTELWAQWYGESHATPALVAEAVYGLPELHRDAIRGARLVANPGCYPTTVQLGFLPLLEAGIVDQSSLIADCKSGVSGAGRKASMGTLLSEVSESFKAYGVPGHRHQPEIKQGLETIAGGAVGLTFVPHLVPMIRGIHSTLYARVTDDSADIQSLFEKRFADETFVDVMPAGSHPDTRSVRGSNTCRIAVHRPQDSDLVVVLSVEDNLVKGAAGQAIQNMNIMCGIEETTGLTRPALLP